MNREIDGTETQLTQRFDDEGYCIVANCLSAFCCCRVDVGHLASSFANL